MQLICSAPLLHVSMRCTFFVLSSQGPTPAIKKVRQQFLFLINQSARIHTRIQEKNCRSWEIDAPVRRDFYVDAELECASLAMKKKCILMCVLSRMHILLRRATPCNPFPFMCITPISIFWPTNGYADVRQFAHGQVRLKISNFDDKRKIIGDYHIKIIFDEFYFALNTGTKK